jgi:hypothetical protein
MGRACLQRSYDQLLTRRLFQVNGVKFHVMLFMPATIQYRILRHKRVNAVNPSQCIDVCVEKCTGSKIIVAECCREDLLVAHESWSDWRFFAVEDLKNLENTCESDNVRKRNIEARWCNRCCCRKAISNNYIYQVCVCSLSYPACKAHEWYCGLCGYTMFCHITSQTSRFSGKKLLNIKCVSWLSLQLLPETILILRRIQPDNIINVDRSLCKLPVILARFSKNNQISNFMKVRPVGAKLFHADERTGMAVLTVVFAILWTCLKRREL